MSTNALTDQDAFAAAAEPHRSELQLHCYRMLASLEDAQDLVQETFLRAWRKRDSFAGRASFRAWLYGIATNACLDAIERRKRALAIPPGFEVTWLQPYPDELLDAAVERETVELAFLVAVQHLPAQGRAVLILRDVVGWSAKEVAAELDTTVAAVNSALQRARATLAEKLPAHREQWARDPEASARERELVARYAAASEQPDIEALRVLLREDVRFAMPPEPKQWSGRDRVIGAWVEGGFGTEEYRDFRAVVAHVNRQPAVAMYLRRPGEAEYRWFAIDVLDVRDGGVADIVTFTHEVFPSLGLPEVLA